MDNRKRFLEAIKLKQPDRVPYFDKLFNEESIIKIGSHFTTEIPEKKFFIDCTLEEAMQFYEIQIMFTRKLDLDATGFFFNVGGIRIENTIDLMKNHYGVINKISEHGTVWPIDGPIKEPGDLNKIGSMIPLESDFKLFKFIRKSAPERVAVFTVHDPFRYSWSLLGKMEKLLFNFVQNPEFCLKLARVSTDFVKSVMEIAIEQGAEVIIISGDLAFKTNTLMSLEHYKRFVKPFHYELTDLAHRKGIPIIKHSDGNIWLILDDLIEAGFDGIHSIEPSAMKIEDVKEHTKGRICLMGNIDCTHLLPFGEREEVIKNVKETIIKAAKGGGYILCSSNSIHPGCKAENVIAMFEAAKEYGTYPIKAN